MALVESICSPFLKSQTKLSTMRLVLCFLLLTLALCCYEANAKVCEAVMRESTIFIMGTEAQLEAELQKYGAPPEAVEAKLEVKRCVDENLNVIEKGGIAAILGEVAAKCALTP